MLNKIQEAQFAAFMTVVKEDHEFNIGAELVERYLALVDQKEFIENASNFADVDALGVANEVSGVTYMADPVAFYTDNRKAVVSWLTNYRRSADDNSVINFVQALIEIRGGGNKEVVSAEAVGMALYGKEQDADYATVATRLAVFVAENTAMLFNVVNGDPIHERAEVLEAKVGKWLAGVDTSDNPILMPVGSELAGIFVNEVGFDLFSKTANGAYFTKLSDDELDDPNSQQKNPTVAYHDQPASFFNRNHKLMREWVERYMTTLRASSALQHIACVASTHKHKVSIDDVAQVLYCNDLNNAEYATIAPCITDMLAEVLAHSFADK